MIVVRWPILALLSPRNRQGALRLRPRARHLFASSSDSQGAIGLVGLPRLYVQDTALCSKSLVSLEPAQAHYLLNVMRISNTKRWGNRAGSIRLFNGKDGEWLASLVEASRGSAVAECVQQIHPQVSPTRRSVVLWMAPPKKQPRKWVLEKLTELGVSAIRFVDTEYSGNEKDLDSEKNFQYVIQASQQCERLSVPHVSTSLTPLVDIIDQHWTEDPSCAWLVCQERSETSQSIKSVLEELDDDVKTIHVLVGPEGGWSPNEVATMSAQIEKLSFVQSVSLGKLILRAETAAIAAASAVMILDDYN